MDKLLDKISSYNIFTNLVPGIVFCYLVENLYSIPLIQSDLVTGAFVYYFIGMVVSRVGSIVVEPLLERVGYLQYALYGDYVKAKQKDPQIDVLLETNNTYRSALALLVSTGIAGVWSSLIASNDFIKEWSNTVIVILLLALFMASFKKQTNYIKKRIEVINEGESSDS